MVSNWLFEHIPVSASTNTDLMDRWRKHELSKPVSRMADVQTAGRGRRGRQWLSTPESSLTFSIAYPFSAENGIPHLSGLSLACGVILIQGLSKYYDCDPNKLHHLGLGLKWPNDILVQSSKLAGILIEGGQSSPELPCWMVIGIGINLSSDPSHNASSDYKAASLDEIAPKPTKIDVKSLWESLSNTYAEQLARFDRLGFSGFKEDWEYWNAFKNQAVDLRQNDSSVLTGECYGVNDQGVLLIKTPEGIKSIHNGDLSLRLSL